MNESRDFLPRLKELKLQKELGRGMALCTFFLLVTLFTALILYV